MRRRDQTGASLVLVLGLIAFLGLMVPAILGLAMVGSAVTRPVVEDRRELYAASSAIEAAVELGRSNVDVGVPGGPCPEQVLAIDSLEVTVQCEQHAFPDDGCLFLDRFVTYTAEVRGPGDTEVLGRSAAEVVYRFSFDDVAAVEVRQWNPDASGPVPTTTLPPCATVPTTTSTTTTSTMVPVTGAYAAWGVPSTETRSGNQWRAVGPMDVTDHNGVPLENAAVTLAVDYQVNAGPAWAPAAQIVGSTTTTGSITFHSAWYPRSTSQPVTGVRMTVLAVTTAEGLAWNAAAHPLTIEVARP